MKRVLNKFCFDASFLFAVYSGHTTNTDLKVGTVVASYQPQSLNCMSVEINNSVCDLALVNATAGGTACASGTAESSLVTIYH